MKDLKIFAKTIEPQAQAQIDLLLAQKPFEDCKVRIMPDVHAGAGRLMSRAKAKASIPMEDYRAAMEGIYTTSVCRNTLDEAPQAYKPMDEILSCISDTVTVLQIIKPVYNFKAGD